MEHIGWIVNVSSFLLLLGLGLCAGQIQERLHLRDLARREAEFSGMLVTQLKSFPRGVPGRTPPSLVVGEAVMATDYLKSFLSGVRKFFGGEMRSYQTLLTRARREALLRVQEQARALGFDAVCNVRFEAADVGGNTTMKKVATVAILASATAYHAKKASAPSDQGQSR